MKNQIKWILLHHSGGVIGNPLEDTAHHTLEIINNWHRSERYPKSSMGFYAGYHYIIEKTGRIRQARLLTEEGAHCKGFNNQSVGICMTGNFDRPSSWVNSYPTQAQIKSLKTLLDEITDKYNINVNRIVPHRKFAFKTCYGRNLGDDWGKGLFSEVIKMKISLIERVIVLLIKLKSMITR